MHEIILEEILHKDFYLKYPICLAGERSCPPEDCGGINGYKKMMDIVMNPKHEEYESYIEWLDGEFEPEYFNKTHVNKLLSLEE